MTTACAAALQHNARLSGLATGSDDLPARGRANTERADRTTAPDHELTPDDAAPNGITARRRQVSASARSSTALSLLPLLRDRP